MKFLLKSPLVITSLFSVFILNCNDSGRTSITGMVGLQNPPVITGIRVTTIEDPEGYSGIVLGNPSYPMPGSKHEKINAVPNPYYAYSPLETDRFDSYVRFIRLPRQVSIEIYRGIAPVESPDFYQISSGAVLPEVATPFQRFEKNDNSSIFRWDLIRDDTSYVLSGFYRAYFSTEEEGIINWVDMYILSRVDCSTWVDPTGWLREDWNLLRFGWGEGEVVIDVCQMLSGPY